jgi:hypothetical protein
MRLFFPAFGVALATALALSLAAAPALAQTVPGLPPDVQPTLRFAVPSHSAAQTAAMARMLTTGSATIPHWGKQVISPLDHHTYTEQMVGRSPYAAAPPNPVKITVVPIILRFRWPNWGNVVIDPSQPACDDTVPMATRFLNSPLFVPTAFTSNGVDVSAGSSGGILQLADAFQRANFWSLVGGTRFGVQLVLKPAIYVEVLGPPNSGPQSVTVNCGGQMKNVEIGDMAMSDYDAVVQSLLAKYANPKELGLVLSHNILMTDDSGQCCILGYHNAVATPAGVQTYATGGYFDVFPTLPDIYAFSHEVVEWMDDPFVQQAVPQSHKGRADLTPPWGHIGQVNGCQNNLEAADPLTDSLFSITGTDGFVYHYQDLAFSDWFFRTASKGAGGQFSFQGTFTSAQGACR